MIESLELLLQKDRITEVITLLFVRTDERDWEGVRACLADRVLFDMTSLAGGEPTTRTPDEIVAGWEEGLRGLAAIHHQIGNLIIHNSEAEADASCYGIASHYLPNPTNANTRVFVGSYDFHLVRAEGRWRIDRFRFNLKYVEGNRDLEASAGRRA